MAILERPDSRRTTLLRVATAGSVDDGKSTLIGRLLHDSKAVLDDQLEAVVAASERRGTGYTDLALLTDGLRAEREQGITIDVAHRYFATTRRTFVLADTPGHEQYTRNMVTGASTADAAVVLLDVRRGMTDQSRRHTAIAGLLRVPHLVAAVNKIDLVDFSPSAFLAVAREFAAYAERVGFVDVLAVPVSALHGDNVVTRSTRTPWYDGPALLEHLEHVETSVSLASHHLRFPVQYVVRAPGAEFRGYAGTVASGTLRTGDEVVVLPSGRRSAVRDISTYDGSLEEASAGRAVVVRLADDLDVGRGDLLATPEAPPTVSRELRARLCWLAETAVRPGARFLLRHTTREVDALVRSVDARLDLTSLTPVAADALQLNDIGEVTIVTSEPLAVDTYADNRATGAFVLVDEASGATVGAGMVEAA